VGGVSGRSCAGSPPRTARLCFELGVLDLVRVVDAQLDVDGCDVLVEPVQLRRPGNRHDPRLLREQPGERDLRRGHAIPPGDPREQLDERTVPPACLEVEARNGIAEVAALERRALIDRAGEKAFAERAERDEPDTELFERRQDRVFGLAPPQRVLALQRRHRLDRMCAPNLRTPASESPK